jgi:UDP-glucose:(heptosyl)LPS alpha-1,3-glucosyltransferase
VIPNGVDRDVFSPGTLDARRAARARFGIPDSGPCALFIGGDWGRKGLQFAIDALAEASDWHLAVAGRGDTSAYRDLARHAGVVDRVHFLGIVRDSPDLYRAADALVLPTAYETFSLVAYEAASAGLPLLATAVSGIEDILIDGVTGLRIERDASQIASRLRAISAAPEIGPRMGAAARRATEGYTWGALISRHRALYAELRAKHRDGTTGRDTQPAGE